MQVESFCGSLFDFPKVEIKKKIRLIELFGGICSQAMALRDIGADFEHYRLVEFDKYAVASYNAIHGTDFITSDIRNVHGADLGIKECDKYEYIMTYSFPCTDLSVAGKMEGMSKKDWESGKSTRSGLLWEVERILKELPAGQLPQILVMENVPQVHAEQNMADFESWQKFLREKGYHNFYKDLNAKEYGIPQNRDRCFMVSVLSDDFIEYEFPKGVRLEKVMNDFLEDEVDEKYYINSEKAQKLIDDLINRGELEEKSTAYCNYNKVEKVNCDVAKTLCARDFKGFDTMNSVIEKQKEVKVIGQMDNTLDHTFESANRIYDKEQLAPTLPTGCGGGHTPKIIEESYKYIVAMRERNPENPTSRTAGLPTEQRLEPAPQGIVNTLTTVQKANMVLETGVKYRIRKLTPRECWRLMGYTDEDFDKAAKVNSNSQLYKQAGNAIVKQVLMAIFAQMITKSMCKAA